MDCHWWAVLVPAICKQKWMVLLHSVGRTQSSLNSLGQHYTAWIILFFFPNTWAVAKVPSVWSTTWKTIDWQIKYKYFWSHKLLKQISACHQVDGVTHIDVCGEGPFSEETSWTRAAVEPPQMAMTTTYIHHALDIATQPLLYSGHKVENCVSGAEVATSRQTETVTQSWLILLTVEGHTASGCTASSAKWTTRRFDRSLGALCGTLWLGTLFLLTALLFQFSHGTLATRMWLNSEPCRVPLFKSSIVWQWFTFCPNNLQEKGGWSWNLRDVHTSYHRQVASIIERWNGFLYNHLKIISDSIYLISSWSVSFIRQFGHWMWPVLEWVDPLLAFSRVLIRGKRREQT